MKKYVIGYDEQCLFICKTRADAEECILSIAEENIYENWYIENCAHIWRREKSYCTPAEYISKNSKNCQESNKWAWVLYVFSAGYWIDEVEELE